MKYRISVNFPNGSEGYNIFDYLPDGADQLRFATAAAAIEWATQNSKGPDPDGIEHAWQGIECWPGTRAGLIEAIGAADALAQTANDRAEESFWTRRAAELRGYAVELNPVELEKVAEISECKVFEYKGAL